jgi:hypothetical protein
MALTPRWIPIVRSAVYKDAHCRITGIWSAINFRILTAHTLRRLKPKMRELARRKHGNPGRQSSHSGRFLLAVAMEGLYNWSNVS